MHHCGVVFAAKHLADVVQAHAGEFTHQIHGDLAGQRDFLRARTADDVVERDVEVFRHLGDDVGGLDFHIGREEVLQRMLRQRASHRLPAQGSHGSHAVQRAFQLADVLGETFRNKVEHVVLNVGFMGDHAQNGDSRLQIRRFDVNGQAGFEAGNQAFVEALQILRRHIGCDHDALVRLVQGVERVEELFERRVLAAEELDIVDQQHVDFTVATVEFLDLAGILVGVAQCFDEFVGEFLAGHVTDLQRGILDQRVVADGVQQVGFAQAGAAVDTQRVEIMTGTFRDGQCDGACETVGIARDEGVEGGVLVQMGLRVQQRPVLASLEGVGAFRRHDDRNRELALRGFLNMRRGGKMGVFLDDRLGGFLLFHDLECGENILFGGLSQRLQQRLAQFVLQRLLRGRAGHAQHNGGTPHTFRKNIFQPAFVTYGKRGILVQQRQRVGPYPASLIERIGCRIGHGFPFLDRLLPVVQLFICTLFSPSYPPVSVLKWLNCE